MPSRQLAELIENYHQQLRQMRQQGCSCEQVLDLAERMLEQIEPYPHAFAAAEADQRVLRTLLDHIPEGVTVVEMPDLRIRASSKAGLALTGRDPNSSPTAAEYVRETGIRTFHADGVTPAQLEDMPLIRAVRQGDVVLDEEYVIERADGRRIPLLCCAVPVRDETGRVTSGLVTYRSIEERKQLEKLLEEREQRWRSLFQYNLDAVFHLDEQGRLTEVNPAALELTGYAKEELLGKPVVDLCLPEHRAAALGKFRDALQGKSATLDVAIAHKDGRRIEVLVTGGPVVVGGRTVGVFGIAKDVTEHRKADAEIRRLNEELERRVTERTARLEAANLEMSAQISERRRVEQELRESESKYRSIVENTHDVIMLTRSDGIILYMSPATRNVLGYEPEELVGRKPWIVHPEDTPHAHEIHRRALQGEAGSDLEYRIVTKAGEIKWVSHTWTVIPGEPYHTIVSVVRDITERKKAQEQIMHHEAQLRALASELILAEERERRRIATDLHDDLSQKLAVAKIRLCVLGQSAGEDLAGAVDQVRKIIDEAILSTRSLTFQICPPALYDLGFLPAAEWLAEDMQQRYGLQVRLTDDGRPKPMDERVRVVLFRCLRELLINVAKHAGVNAATVNICRHDNTIQLVVEDAGKGFDPPKTAGSTSRGGFGLFSIQERLGYLGGQIQVRSSPRQGATIVLRVPAQLADSQGPEVS